jgi:methionine--tRNA ligase beta chain
MLKEPVQFDEWLRNDLRIGRVVMAEKPEWSEKLLQLTVDFGEEIGQKTIFTGMAKYFEPEIFVGKQSIFLLNLPPRKMGPGESQGMLLAGEADAEGKPALMLFDELAPNGTPLA